MRGRLRGALAKQWVHVSDKDGRRRLENDFVRRELAAALSTGANDIVILLQALDDTRSTAQARDRRSP